MEVSRQSRHVIKYDASFAAGKKLTSEQREDYEKCLGEEAHVAVPTVIPEKQRRCKPGCLKPWQTGGHRYRTRRHFYSKSSRIAAAAAVVAQATQVDATFAGSAQIYFVIDTGVIVKYDGRAVDLDRGRLQDVEQGRLAGSGYPAAA